MILYPYRVNEVPLARRPRLKKSCKFWSRPSDHQTRPAMAVSLGCHFAHASGLFGAALCKADPDDTESVVQGNAKRMGFDPPKPNRKLRRKFQRFVGRWLRRNLTPLSPDTDLSVEKWLREGSYTQSRQRELLALWEELGGVLKKKHFICKSFIKDEFYMEWKYPRGINSRHDAFKCAVGPYFHEIEKQLFALPWFIKKVPIQDRAEFIMQHVYKPGAKYLATDYTSFEAQFTRPMMMDCEFQLYKYMVARCPGRDQFIWYLDNVIAGMSICNFKNVRVILEATRMSGEMCTSLGNGFSNLMFMLFVAEQKGVSGVSGVVEGDDGLFSFKLNGALPFTEADFTDLGLVIKPVWHDSISTASFCGLVFDEEDKELVCDPFKALLTFGFANRRYLHAKPRVLKQLLRCKALSLAHQYPGCPIVASLAAYGLRVTEGVTVGRRIYDAMDVYEREKHLAFAKSPVPAPRVKHRTRLLVERLYGIPLEQQIGFEDYLQSLTDIQPLFSTDLYDLMNEQWKTTYDMYVQVVLSKHSLNNPYPCWTSRKDLRLAIVSQSRLPAARAR